MDKQEENKKTAIRPMPLYGLLVCSIILVITGLVLTIEKTDFVSNGLPGRGASTGQNVVVNGPFTLILGLLGGAVAIYYLKKDTKP